MFKVTRYCVEAFSSQGGRLVRADVQQFRERADALRAGAVMRKRAAEVAVYEVTGWPVQDLWDRPRRIATFRSQS